MKVATQAGGSTVFSVVIPAYNAEDTIGSAIRSVLGQERDDFEVLAVDDGSTDATAAEVERLARPNPRVRLVSQSNAGPGAARNAGIERARGRYVSFLDSDDLLMPGYLGAMGSALDAAPQASFAYTDAWVLDEASRRIRRRSAMSYQHPPRDPPADSEEFLLRLLRNNFIFVSTTVRREVFDVTGGFDTALSRAHDYEMWLRIVVNGYRSVRVPGRLAIYRAREGSLSSDRALVVESLLAALDSLERHDKLSTAARAVIASRRESLRMSLALYSGDDRKVPLRRRLRRRLAHAKTRMLERGAYHASPPAEVLAAFPDLESI